LGADFGACPGRNRKTTKQKNKKCARSIPENGPPTNSEKKGPGRREQKGTADMKKRGKEGVLD